MPHTKSAAKRLRQTEKRRKRNRTWVKAVKKQTRTVGESIAGGDLSKAGTDLVAAQKKLDQAAAKGIIHKNKAARLKSKLVKRLRAASTNPPAEKG
jgi:small subunit ribosomal protein S20